MSRVLAALEGHARARPQDVAVSGSSIRFSYAALAEQVERTAEALSALASDRPTGSAVAVMLDNSPAWVILDLALIRLGWPSLPIPAFFRLPADLQEFVMIFLRCQGKIRDVEKELGVSYPTVIKRLELVNVLLGNQAPPAGRKDILEQLERGEITVQEATQLLKTS